VRWRLRHAPRVDPASLTPFERAAMLFNASEAGREVSGLVRTLGTPMVSVGASAGSREEARITVAWELSWYQWAVDLGEEARPVAVLAKGSELEQLDPAARQWNASVDGGRVVVAAPARRRGAAGLRARR
jgi:hypothetical protein